MLLLNLAWPAYKVYFLMSFRRIPKGHMNRNQGIEQSRLFIPDEPNKVVLLGSLILKADNLSRKRSFQDRFTRQFLLKVQTA